MFILSGCQACASGHRQGWLDESMCSASSNRALSTSSYVPRNQGDLQRVRSDSRSCGLEECACRCEAKFLENLVV